MPTAFRDGTPASAGSTFLPLGLLLGLGGSVVLGGDGVDHNVDKSAPDLARTGTTALEWAQEWGLGEVRHGIFQIPG